MSLKAEGTEKTHMPRETYSQSMSLESVPLIFSGGTFCFRPTARYMARRTAAGAFILKEHAPSAVVHTHIEYPLLRLKKLPQGMENSI